MGKPRKPHKPRTDWQDRDKRSAVIVYKSLGSIVKTSEVTGIPERTLAYWKETDWWKEQLLQAKSEDSAQLEDVATNIAKHALDVVEDRLSTGNSVLNRDGELVKVPVSARDAAIIAAVAIDKRKILQEEPIRDQQLGTNERLLKLVEQFVRFSNAKEVKGMLKETEVLEMKEGPPAVFGAMPVDLNQVNERVEDA